MILSSFLLNVLILICILVENVKKVMHNTVEELRAEIQKKPTRRSMNGAQKEARRKHELIIEARREFYALRITNMDFVQMVCGVIGNRWAGQPQGVIIICFILRFMLY